MKKTAVVVFLALVVFCVGSKGVALARRAGVTTPPSVTAPVVSTTYTSLIPLSFVLPQTPLTGSLKATFSSETSSAVIIMTLSSASQTQSFNIDPTNLLSGSHISSVFPSGNTLAYDRYTVTLSYQDSGGDPAGSTSVQHVTYAQVTPTPTPTATSTPTPANLSGKVTYVGVVKVGSTMQDFSLSYNSPLIQGTGTVGATVTITIHSNPIIQTAVVGSNGTWSSQFTHIPDGAHTLLITETSGGSTITLASYSLAINQGIPETGESIVPYEVTILSLMGCLVVGFLLLRKKVAWLA